MCCAFLVADGCNCAAKHMTEGAKLPKGGPLRRILRDPLCHFLLAGVAIFALYGFVGGNKSDIADAKRIVVDRPALLSFMQFQSKAFQPDKAAARLNKMDDATLKRLVNDYVREEALYREAQKLGLGDNDYVIKRRMIQKVNFIAEGFAEATIRVTDKELRDYFESNKKRYAVAPFATFTHVFFDRRMHKGKNIHALANAKLDELRKTKQEFSDAPKHGDRFPFGTNYVERTKDHVQRHMGPEMARDIFSLKPSLKNWHGPFHSPYGLHLVMLADMHPARQPKLDEVKARVRSDALREKQREQAEKAVGEILITYDVEVNLEALRQGGKVAKLVP